jgi:hypothetical protein
MLVTLSNFIFIIYARWLDARVSPEP